MDETNAHTLRSLNWAGSIPITLTLAPSSLSSPTMPPPQHRMVSRMTYLHVGLQEAVSRLHKFAPAALSSSIMTLSQTTTTTTTTTTENNDKNETNDENDFDNDDETTQSSKEKIESSHYPKCWFEDEETGVPLRWHLFTGVLYDLITRRHQRHRRHHQHHRAVSKLPWKIRLHFTSYPSSQILNLEASDVLMSVERYFSNSLKQALFLQHGSSKVAMSVSKLNHTRIWDAVVRSNYEVFGEVNRELWAKVCWKEGETEEGKNGVLKNVPVRVMVDGKPMIQRPCRPFEKEEGSDKLIKLTLGKLLSEWLPSIFTQTKDNSVVITTTTAAAAADSSSLNDSIYWTIQGLQPPLTYPIVDLWQALSYPDHFLYITVSHC